MSATAPTGTGDYDAVVVGGGVAGMTAAVRAAEAGARVLVVAKGFGGTHLAPGTVDVLGFAPDRVERPGAALEAFAAEHPEHPYALLGPSTVAAALAWFAARVEAGPLAGYRYAGDLEGNVLLPTAVGAVKPSALVPETMAAGDVRVGGAVCVVGVGRLRDFYARLLADNLSAEVAARAVVLDPEVEGRGEINSQALGRAFDDPAWRAGFARELRTRLRPEDERVALPAGLGLDDPHGAWTDLQERLERPVFEVPTLPPSVPGMRVFRVLRDALRRARGRITIGGVAVGAEREGGRLVGLRVRAAGHDVVHRARWFVLATGGFAAGGLALDARWRARETVLGLPLAHVPDEGEARFRADLWGEQPMGRVGVPVDAGLRPVDAGGARVEERVLVAGATLAGAEPWREGSGDGLSLASGYRAGGIIVGEES